MRLHIGAIPTSPGFTPGTLWKALGLPSPWKEKLIVLPLGVVAAAAVAIIWFAVTPIEQLTPTITLHTFLLSFVKIAVSFGLYPNPLMSFPVFLFSFAGLVVVHELLHAVVYPKALRSRHTTIGCWPSGMICYARYEGELTRTRFLVVLVMPMVVISFVPLFVSAISQLASRWVAFISVFNAFGACGDLFIASMMMLKIPPKAIVRDEGGKFYWREHGTLSA